MYIRKDAKEYVHDYNGIKKLAAKICVKLNAPIVRMLNWEMEHICQELQKTEHLSEFVNQMDKQLKRYEQLDMDIKTICSRLEGYDDIAQSVKNIQSRLARYEWVAESVPLILQQLEKMEKLSENISRIEKQLNEDGGIIASRNQDHERLERIDDELAMYGVRISRLQKLLKPSNKINNEKMQMSVQDLQQEDAAEVYSCVDYFDFENHFRGSRSLIKRRQEIYIPYFKGKTHVIDLGCGRGEFLELLKENCISGCGVDSYLEFVEYCLSKGLHAVQGDAIAFLKNTAQSDGIFAGQLIEHLSFQYLMCLIETAYKKLNSGCYFVVETPNPTSLAIYANSFYADPSHNKPVHPYTLKYFMEKAGFKEVSVIFTENSRIPVKIPKLEIHNANGIEEFNQAMHEIEQLLYGSQDYAVIAKK